MKHNTFSEAWVDELYRVQEDGELTAPRGQTTCEIRWSQIEVVDSMSFPVKAVGRDFRNVIGVLEALSLVGQVNVPETFTARVAKFGEFLDDGIFHGAYGPRAHGALGDVVQLLERDPDSRQAVITVFDSSRDLNRVKKDIPCTIALHLMRRGDKLELNVTMRSNDIWLGTPYDFTQFAVLQASVAQALGLTPGKYFHSAGSLHLYERNFESADAIHLGELNPMSMDFPLWADVDSIGGISKRARDLLFNPYFVPKTMFESWAFELLK